MDTAAMEVARLVLRQDSGAESSPDEEVTCKGNNKYDGRMGIRISAIFVILIGSAFGKSAPATTIPFTKS
jgi:zinc transporter 1/2/3